MISRSVIQFAVAALASLNVVSATGLGCYSSVSVADDKGQYMYQSSSYCVGQCPDYAFVATKNGNECYCLNSFPSGSQSNSCNMPCVAWQQDNCGGSNSYQVYQGSGSIGANSASGSSSAGNSPASTSTSSSTQTTTSKPTTGTSSSSTSTSTTSKSSSTEVPSSDTSESKTSSATSTGASVVTKTTTAANSSSTSSETSTSSSNSSPTPAATKKSSNTGAIVGGVVGGAAGLAIIALLVFLFVRHRRNADDEDDEEFFEPQTKSGSTRAVSRGASKKHANPLEMPMTNPFTHPSDATVAAGGGGSAGMVDPRLNPIMMGRRRLSEGSLVDEADYSRKILSVANPDH
ncbi:hypothetical protein CAAN1_07S05776 [[Candida] anglica]|uniref:WSC domain-containing protein n=1 Tax=[Candida] anglica TaxID=148631 RepID=A0ABP0EBH1_9ASCO